jgi:PAS domain S-box-containing protein
VIRAPALVAVMQALTEEARSSLSAATPQPEAVRRLEEAVRVQPVAVLFADNSGKYIGANPAASALTGYSRRELLRFSLWDMIPAADEREAEVLWRAFLRVGRQEGDITLNRRDGSQISARYLAGTNLVPGVHVSVLAKL